MIKKILDLYNKYKERTNIFYKTKRVSNEFINIKIKYTIQCKLYKYFLYLP